MPHCARPNKEAPGLDQGQSEQGENVGKDVYCGFCRQKQVSQGEEAYGWLVQIISAGSEVQ